MTGKEGLLQAMMEAYVMEVGTNDFYMQAAAKARDEEAKKAFGNLARWEKDHMNYIGFLYQAILEERETKSFDDFKKTVKPEEVEGGMPLAGLEGKLEKYSFLDDMGALILALEIEGKAYSMYNSLSEGASDPSTKAFMKEMMGWELKHIDYLKELRLRIAETS